MTLLIVLTTMVAILAVWRPLYSFWLVIGAAVIQDDRLFYETALFHDMAPLPTVFNSRLMGLQLIDWYVVILLGAGAAALWRRKVVDVGWLRKAVSGRTAIWLAAATLPYVLSFVWGLVRGNPWMETAQDMQNHLYLLALAFIFATVVPDRPRVKQTVVFLMAALAVKAVILMLRYAFRVGIVWVKVFRVTLSSDTILLLVLLAVLLFLLARPWGRSWAGWGLVALSSVAYFILFETSGRTIMLLFAAQTALLFFLLPRHQFPRVLAVLVAWNAVLALYLVAFDRPLAQFYWWRVKSIFWWGTEQYGRDGSLLSNAVKTLEIKNVLTLLSRERALVFGLGQGAHWQDVFYPIKLAFFNDGYAPGEVRHFSTHLLPLTQLLKMGIIGLAFYWTSVTGLLATAVKRAIGSPGPEADLYRVVSLALVPLLFNMSGYVRLFFFLGLFVGIMLWMDLWGGMPEATRGDPAAGEGSP